MDAAIRVEGLTKDFRIRIKPEGPLASLRAIVAPRTRSLRAVDGISFAVERGELLAFIGPNGAGKSTTIKLITGILHPDAGRIEVLGLDPHRDRKRVAYRIGTVFGQKSQLWFHLPPLDSFRLLAGIYDVERREAARRIEELTAIFDIADVLEQPVRKLSLGQRIRCEVAASLIHRPEVLFLDEPTIGLDVVVKQRLRDLIRRVNSEDGVTVFLTSHDVGDIEKICRRAIVINHGTIVRDDTIKNMKYSLGGRRIIDLKLDSPLALDLAGVTVLKSHEYSAKLEVDLQQVDLETVIASIFGRNAVQDIAVSSPPMEEVIARLYKDEGQGGG
jgi:ABC-2 type transport system ATP-binding protein